MSIRNKRLFKEQMRTDMYEIYWPADWSLQDKVILKCMRKDILLTLNITMDYPFQYPKMLIENIDYIQWVLNKKAKFNDLHRLFNINTPCICCDTITCKWSPAFGIADMIKEFDKYYSYIHIVEKFKIIYKKINGFDDLIYQNILYFLCLHNI